MRFANLPELDAPYRYNPYQSSSPNYYGTQPLFGSIDGTQTMGNDPTTWNQYYGQDAATSYAIILSFYQF